MANVKIQFVVKVNSSNQVYLVGNIPSLGAWDVDKAIELKYCDKCDKFTVSKMIPEGQLVEFKFLAGKNWSNVEKGTWNEDVINHSFVAEKGLKIEIEIPNFGA